MMALMSPRLWAALAIALFLAFSHGMAYKSGRAAVRAKWDAEKIIQLADAAKAESANRAKELALNQKVIEAQNESQIRVKKLKADADSARAAANSLRDDLAATRAKLPSLTRDAVDRYAATASVVFGDCSRAYQELAGTADAIASERQTLMDAWPK